MWPQDTDEACWKIQHDLCFPSAAALVGTEPPLLHGAATAKSSTPVGATSHTQLCTVPMLILLIGGAMSNWVTIESSGKSHGAKRSQRFRCDA